MVKINLKYDVYGENPTHGVAPCGTKEFTYVAKGKTEKGFFDFVKKWKQELDKPVTFRPKGPYGPVIFNKKYIMFVELGFNGSPTLIVKNHVDAQSDIITEFIKNPTNQHFKLLDSFFKMGVF